MENCHRIFTSRDKNLQLKFGGSFIHDNNILAMIEEAFEDTSVEIDKLELTETSYNRANTCKNDELWCKLLPKLSFGME